MSTEQKNLAREWAKQVLDGEVPFNPGMREAAAQFIIKATAQPINPHPKGPNTGNLTNLERAALEIVGTALDIAESPRPKGKAEAKARECAVQLAKLGILNPELPEPDLDFPQNDPTWSGKGFTVLLQKTGAICVIGQRPGFALSPGQARALAGALTAAAKRVEALQSDS